MSRIQDRVMDMQERTDYEPPPDILDPDEPTEFIEKQAADEPPF